MHRLGCILGPDVWPDGGAGQDDPGLQFQRTPLHGDGQQTIHSQTGNSTPGQTDIYRLLTGHIFILLGDRPCGLPGILYTLLYLLTYQQS